MVDIFLKVILSTKFWGTILVVAGSILGYIFIREMSLSYIEKKKKKATSNQKKRLTLLNLCISILKYVVVLVDIIIILGIFNVKVTPFLAGLGIIGVVVGLALQDLLKDLISGIFIVLDDNYSVGDVIEVGGFRGDVVSVGLKSTKLKNYEGDIHVFSNRNITDVINYSKTSSKAVIFFTFPSDIDLLKVEEAVEELIIRCKRDIEDLVGLLHYKGVESYESGKLTIKITADVKALKQFKVENYIRREAKLLFDEREIKIA